MAALGPMGRRNAYGEAVQCQARSGRATDDRRNFWSRLRKIWHQTSTLSATSSNETANFPPTLSPPCAQPACSRCGCRSRWAALNSMRRTMFG